MKSGNCNYGTEELQGLYRERFGTRSAYRNAVWSALVKNYFQRYVHATDTVLDLGAGYAEFINNINCAKKYAMDLNPDTAEHINPEVTLLAQDCSTTWRIPNASLDVVFTSNFFEHLPDTHALHRTLAESYRCLKSKGLLIALGPNIRYTGEAYWEIEDHQLALSDLTLTNVLVETGFTIEKRIDKFLPFTMSEGPQYPTFFITVYLHLPLAWRIFGKQFLLVARKS